MSVAIDFDDLVVLDVFKASDLFVCSFSVSTEIENEFLGSERNSGIAFMRLFLQR